MAKNNSDKKPSKKQKTPQTSVQQPGEFQDQTNRKPKQEQF